MGLLHSCLFTGRSWPPVEARVVLASPHPAFGTNLLRVMVTEYHEPGPIFGIGQMSEYGSGRSLYIVMVLAENAYIPASHH